jgi:hypothetical protein
VTSVPNNAVLQNARVLAYVSHNMYAATHGEFTSRLRA